MLIFNILRHESVTEDTDKQTDYYLKLLTL